MIRLGGKKRSNSIHRRIKRGGGGAPMPYGYAPVDEVGPLPPGETNFLQQPTFSTNMVGGNGYGYSNGSENSTFGGSYPAQTKYACPETNSRGGNNVLSGGRRRRSKMRGRGRCRTYKRGGSKKKGKRSQKHWRMRGCSKKMRGGQFPMANAMN